MTKFKQKIEYLFNQEVNRYANRKHRNKQTGVKCVLKWMKEHPKMWVWSWELVGKQTSDGSYLSHRAPARASDLAIFHPELVEGRKIGRFSIYRLRTENMSKINKFLKE